MRSPVVRAVHAAHRLCAHPNGGGMVRVHRETEHRYRVAGLAGTGRDPLVARRPRATGIIAEEHPRKGIRDVHPARVPGIHADVIAEPTERTTGSDPSETRLSCRRYISSLDGKCGGRHKEPEEDRREPPQWQEDRCVPAVFHRDALPHRDGSGYRARAAEMTASRGARTVRRSEAVLPGGKPVGHLEGTAHRGDPPASV